jgi:hypothetical protein
VYQDANVTVRALAVQHGSWDQAFGYRFETARRTIVISGDTAPTEAVGSTCDGCDVLLHEVYKPNGQELQMPHWKEYFRALVKQGLSSATVPLEENSIVTLVLEINSVGLWRMQKGVKRAAP